MTKLLFTLSLAVLLSSYGYASWEAPTNVSEYAKDIREADGLAFDSKGNLFVAAETWRGAVYRVTADGQSAIIARGIQSADGVIVDKKDRLYVTSEILDGRVVQVDTDGHIHTLAKLKNPEGMAFDSYGILYIVEDVPHGRVVTLREGRVETFAEGLDRPENVTFDSFNNLFVTETGTGRILKIDPSGKISVFLDTIDKPDGILYYDKVPGLVVSQDKSKDAGVYYVSLDGATITPILTGLKEPQGLAFDPEGNLYVSEQGRHRILKVSSETILNA